MSPPCDVTTCNDACIEKVVIEPYGDFNMMENDDIKLELYRHKKEATNLKDMYPMKDMHPMKYV